MDKDITLKIIGKQYSGDEANDMMEFVTEGKLYERNNAKYLVYEESEFSGFPGCKTTLRLKDNSVRLKRFGGEGYGSEMMFVQGERFTSPYETPYGIMEIEILTNSLDANFGEDGYGDINIDYHVSLNGVAEGRNQLSIQVSEK